MGLQTIKGNNKGRFLSVQARAKLVTNSNNVTCDTQLHCFNVKGLTGVMRVVTLFPKETCSCASTGECYHIIAAKLSVGIPLQQKDTEHNLSQLRRNTRCRKEKRSGRKRPRPNDVDIPLSPSSAEGRKKKTCYKIEPESGKCMIMGVKSSYCYIFRPACCSL